MSKKDAAVLKALADLNILHSSALTPDQEQQLQLAKDPQMQYLDDIERLFAKKRDTETNNTHK